MSKPTLKFVSYTGSYPNLCSGILTVTIDGKPVEFGYSFAQFGLPKFWRSGGSVTFDDGWNECVKRGPWELDPDALPNDLLPLGQQLIDLFNANVEKGCCGGCV